MSINDTEKKRSRGRPQKDTVQLGLRLERDLVSLIDEFRKSEDDIPTRPEAIRRLLNDKLIGLGYKKSK